MLTTRQIELLKYLEKREEYTTTKELAEEFSFPSVPEQSEMIWTPLNIQQKIYQSRLREHQDLESVLNFWRR